jgi:hypothetical protein
MKQQRPYPQVIVTRKGARALAQGRQMNGNHIQALVQVQSERPLLHHFCQVAIGGSHHAHIHSDGFIATHTLYAALRKHTQ